MTMSRIVSGVATALVVTALVTGCSEKAKESAEAAASRTETAASRVEAAAQRAEAAADHAGSSLHRNLRK